MERGGHSIIGGGGECGHVYFLVFVFVWVATKARSHEGAELPPTYLTAMWHPHGMSARRIASWNGL